MLQNGSIEDDLPFLNPLGLVAAREREGRRGKK
jgi:hypothetical protein